ncbi:MAG: NAD(P)-binding protein [Acidimicrobiales bacterium]
MAKPKVTIVGGGMASLAAAYHLSEGNWQDDFTNITVYQMGWRLGGKCASSRNESGRIEEHGLHVWFGSYANSFRMLDRCLRELGGEAPDAGGPSPLEERFRRVDTISVTEFTPDGVEPWMATFPQRPDLPWEPIEALPSLTEQLALAMTLIAAYLRSAVRQAGADPAIDEALRPVVGALDSLARTIEVATRSGAGALSAISDVTTVLGSRIDRDPDVARLISAAVSLGLRVVDRAIEASIDRVDRVVRTSTPLRRAWYLVDVVLAVTRGLLRDGLLVTEDLDSLDDHDFVEWLMANGASMDSARCAVIKGVVYDLAFAYRSGDPNQPRCGAGTALRGLFRLFFTYRGSIMWKMNAGMGEAVVAPLYQLLERRGVTFKFFRELRSIELDDKKARITRLGFHRQIDPDEEKKKLTPRLVGATGHGLDLPYWPSSPYLDGTDAAALERPSNHLPDEHVAIGKDDKVILGISLEPLKDVGEPLMDASPRFRAMVEGLHTVGTEAAQLWLTRSLSSTEKGAHWREGAVVGGFVEPFDTWADMSHLISEEGSHDKVQAIVYLCNALRSGDGDVADARQADGRKIALQDRDRDRVRNHLDRYLRLSAKEIWGDLFASPEGELKKEVLLGGDLNSQYIRANLAGSERYVQSIPGTSRYRLRPDDSGFHGLYLVGDWTRCGLNSGCVEAAVTSGLIAAQHLRPDNRSFTIVGGPRKEVENP